MSGSCWTHHRVSFSVSSVDALCSSFAKFLWDIFLPAPLLLEFIAVCSMKSGRKRGGEGKRTKRGAGRQHSSVQISEQRENFIVQIFKQIEKGRWMLVLHPYPPTKHHRDDSAPAHNVSAFEISVSQWEI